MIPNIELVKLRKDFLIIYAVQPLKTLFTQPLNTNYLN